MNYTNKTTRKPFVESFHGYLDVTSIQNDTSNKIYDPKSFKSRLSEPLKLFAKQTAKSNKSFEAPTCKRRISSINSKPVKKLANNVLKNKTENNQNFISTTNKESNISKNKALNIYGKSKINLDKDNTKNDINSTNKLYSTVLDIDQQINIEHETEQIKLSLESLNSLHIVESQSSDFILGSYFENVTPNDINSNINEILTITESSNTILNANDEDETKDISSHSSILASSSSLSSLQTTSSSNFTTACEYSSNTQYSKKIRPGIDVLAAAQQANKQDFSFLNYAKNINKSNNSLTCPPLFLLMDGNDNSIKNHLFDNNLKDNKNILTNNSIKSKQTFNRPRSTSFLSPETEKSASDFHLQLQNTDDRISRLDDTNNHNNCLSRPFSEIYSHKLGQNSSKLDAPNISANRTLSASSGYFSACISSCLDNQSMASMNNIYNNKVSKDDITKLHFVQNNFTFSNDKNVIKENDINNDYFLTNLSNNSSNSLNISQQIQLARSCSKINSNITRSLKNDYLINQQNNFDSNCSSSNFDNTIIPNGNINISITNNTPLKNDERTNIEFESLKQELKLTKESCSSLKTQLQVNNLIVHTCEQNIESLTTRLKQLTLILEMKENEIARLKSNLNDHKEINDYDNTSQILIRRDSFESISSVGSHASTASSISYQPNSKLHDKKKGWIRNSLSRAFSMRKSRSRSVSNTDADFIKHLPNSMPPNNTTLQINHQSFEQSESSRLELLEERLREKDVETTSLKLEMFNLIQQNQQCVHSINKLQKEVSYLQQTNQELISSTNYFSSLSNNNAQSNNENLLPSNHLRQTKNLVSSIHKLSPTSDNSTSKNFPLSNASSKNNSLKKLFLDGHNTTLCEKPQSPIEHLPDLLKLFQGEPQDTKD